MVERAPQIKRDEQYPLLKVDGGGGDGGVHAQSSPTLVAPGWGVTCSPKQSWLVRWPEYISACWMTLILLGISFLVFYALGMEAYRRQPVLIIKCNNSKPASDVYFHHIVQRGSYAPFMLYADYLSNIASQYPLLHFHVLFLIDDSLQTAFRGPRHTRFINKLIPCSTTNVFLKLDDNSKRELADFQRRYQNVNITVMNLSKYMAMTPLKYKWRAIPLSFIPFYARIFSVWQTGGVGMDLNTFNNDFNSRQHVDRRISAILKQHNDGIKVEEYTNALNKIDREEENEFLTIFYGLIHQILNETRTFLTKSFPLPPIITEKAMPSNEPLTVLNRKKREVLMPPSTIEQNNKTENVSNIYVEIINSTNDSDLKKNEYQTLTNADVNVNKHTANINDALRGFQINNSNNIDSITTLGGMNKSAIQTETFNKSEGPQLVLFYDFSVFTDGIAPTNILQEPLIRSDFRQNAKASEFGKPGKYGNPATHLLALDSEGMFVAASGRLHPFLDIEMKLPFNLVLAPLLKPYLGRTRMFCHHPTFSLSIFYTYLYGILGFVISANHLRKHLGESPPDLIASKTMVQEDQHFMLVHDLKIIATAMGLIQYACLIVGCLTENPSLFLPHMAGQLVIVAVKILNALLLLAPVNIKAIGKLTHKVPAIMLMTFNWLQEFCVFRQYLCICDL